MSRANGGRAQTAADPMSKFIPLYHILIMLSEVRLRGIRVL